MHTFVCIVSNPKILTTEFFFASSAIATPIFEHWNVAEQEVIPDNLKILGIENETAMAYIIPFVLK